MSDPISPVGSLGQIPVGDSLTPPLLPNSAASKANNARPSRSAPESSNTTGKASAAQQAESSSSNAVQSPMDFQEAAKAVEDYIKNLPGDLEFRKDEASGYTIFKVVNPVTQEVIREYPPKELVEMARRLKELSQGKDSGVLVDQQS